MQAPSAARATLAGIPLRFRLQQVGRVGALQSGHNYVPHECVNRVRAPPHVVVRLADVGASAATNCDRRTAPPSTRLVSGLPL